MRLRGPIPCRGARTPVGPRLHRPPVRRHAPNRGACGRASWGRPIEVAVCSTGLIGRRLAMTALAVRRGCCLQLLSATAARWPRRITTTDFVAKMAACARRDGGLSRDGEGAGMLAPDWPRCSWSLDHRRRRLRLADLDAALVTATTHQPSDRTTPTGSMSDRRHWTAALASGPAGGADPSCSPTVKSHVCPSLAHEPSATAEGRRPQDIRIDVVNAATEDDAVTAARAVSRSNLLQVRDHGEDPNWARILSGLSAPPTPRRA